MSLSRAGWFVVVVACALALAPATALAQNTDNPGNHYGRYGNPGNHYGQLKHQQPPPPQPGPSPAPGGAPQSPAAPGLKADGATVSTPAGTTGSGAGTESGPGLPDFPISFAFGGRPSGDLEVGPSNPGGSQEWAILVILPVLLAVWLLLLARTALAAARRRRQPRTAA